MIFWQRQLLLNVFTSRPTSRGQFGPSLSTFGVRRRPRRDRSARGPLLREGGGRLLVLVLGSMEAAELPQPFLSGPPFLLAALDTCGHCGSGASDNYGAGDPASEPAWG